MSSLNVDIVSLLTKYVSGKSNGQRSCDSRVECETNGQHGDDPVASLLFSAMRSIVDHVLFSVQFSESPDLLNNIANTFNCGDGILPMESELALFFAAKGLKNRESKKMARFVLYWLELLNRIAKVLRHEKVHTVCFSLGKSLQRISKSFVINLSDLNCHSLRRLLQSLPATKRSDFARAVGRIVVRKIVLYEADCPTPSISFNHHRIFCCMLVSHSDEVVTPAAEESDYCDLFRFVPEHTFQPFPRPKKVQRKQPKTRKTAKEQEESHRLDPSEPNHQGDIAITVVAEATEIPEQVNPNYVNISFCSDETGISVAQMQEHTDSLKASEEKFWLVPINSSKSPK